MAGGRWNPIGIPMLYTAEHLSLACLEVLVHLEKGQLPRDYVWSKTELTDIPELLTRNIPASVGACQIVGGTWDNQREPLAVRIRRSSSLKKLTFSNPNHTAYASLAWNEPRPFRFDPRLFAVEPQIL